MSQPTFTVEIAFANGPFDTSPTWVDVTQYVRSVDLQRGRQFELDRIEAATLALQIEDDDRRFDPTNTASPYYPNVRPMRPVRYTVVHNAVTYRRFTGFIEAWPQRWEGGGDPRSTIVSLRAVDLFKVFAQKRLLSPYATTILADAPRRYYRFNDAGGLLSDWSGNAAHGFKGGNATPGSSDAAVLDGTGSLQLDGTNSYGVLFNREHTPGASFSWECWVRYTSTARMTIVQLGRSPEYWVELGTLTASAAGKLQFFAFSANLTWLAICQSPAAYNDAAWHYVVCSYDAATLTLSLYVDNVLVDSDVAGGSLNFPALDIALGVDLQTSGQWYAGGLDEFAIYENAVLSSSQRSAHYAARSLRSGEASGTRIGYLLDAIGWPASPRAIDAGVSVMSAADIEGISGLEALQVVADSASGIFLIGGDGVPTFLDRGDRVTSPKATVQATVGDGGGSEIDYETIELSYDDERVFNDVRVTNGGSQTQVEDAASRSSYGPRTLELAVQLANNAEAVDRANFNLARYKDPHIRCESVAFGPVFDDAAWAALLSRAISDRVRLIRRPPTGAAVQQDCFIEAIDETVDGDGLRIGLQLSPASDATVWVLDSSEFSLLGTSTVMGF